MKIGKDVGLDVPKKTLLLRLQIYKAKKMRFYSSVPIHPGFSHHQTAAMRDKPTALLNETVLIRSQAHCTAKVGVGQR